ncbi:MAG: DUF4293 family protein, partial [Bacteroidota bacterium]
MLQRIQTLFLGLTILCMVAGIFFPIWSSLDGDTTHKLFPLQYSIIRKDSTEVIDFPYCLTAILMAAAATIAIMEIRRYDDRILQLKLGTLNSLVLMSMMISAVYFSYSIGEVHKNGANST